MARSGAGERAVITAGGNGGQENASTFGPGTKIPWLSCCPALNLDNGTTAGGLGMTLFQHQMWHLLVHEHHPRF